jgi:hypothetical protein
MSLKDVVTTSKQSRPPRICLYKEVNQDAN